MRKFTLMHERAFVLCADAEPDVALEVPANDNSSFWNGTNVEQSQATAEESGIDTTTAAAAGATAAGGATVVAAAYGAKVAMAKAASSAATAAAGGGGGGGGGGGNAEANVDANNDAETEVKSDEERPSSPEPESAETSSLSTFVMSLKSDDVQFIAEKGFDNLGKLTSDAMTAPSAPSAPSASAPSAPSAPQTQTPDGNCIVS